MENEATTKTPTPTHRASLFWILSPAFCLLPKPPIPARSGCRNFALCTLIFAFSTYLSCHEFIATDPPFLSMDYFSVFSAFSVAISFVPPWLCGHESITQNKANVKMGNINISTARTKAYAKEQRTMTNERYPKQTQSNPIHPPPPTSHLGLPAEGPGARLASADAGIEARYSYPRATRIQNRESRIGNRPSRCQRQEAPKNQEKDGCRKELSGRLHEHYSFL